MVLYNVEMLHHKIPSYLIHFLKIALKIYPEKT